eukprot:330259-Rhodomonas_salina.1
MPAAARGSPALPDAILPQHPASGPRDRACAARGVPAGLGDCRHGRPVPGPLDCNCSRRSPRHPQADAPPGSSEPEHWPLQRNSDSQPMSLRS